MKKCVYVLVADSGRARIFLAEMPVTALTPIYNELHFEGRKKPSEIDTDRPSSKQNDSGASHSFAGECSSYEEDSYARALCKLLDKARRGEKFTALVLVAPPHFLCELRKHLSPACSKILINSHPKDLVKNSDADVLSTLLAGNPELTAIPSASI